MTKRLIVLLVFALSFTIGYTQTATMPSGSGTAGDPYQISTLDNLYWITQNSSSWGSYFVQTADIDASSSSSWDSGAGFSPIGNNQNYFIGQYNGRGYIITGVYINRSSSDYIGLFGFLNNAAIDSLGCVNVNITGHSGVGGLVGGSSSSTVSNSYTKGTIAVPGGAGGSSASVGGLIGINGNGSTVTNSFSTASITGGITNAGGLIGGNTGIISQCYSTGNVTGNGSSNGGLVGSNSGSISNTYATGNVTGSVWNGGLVGNCSSTSVISNSFATGNVTGTDSPIGGLIGYNTDGGTVSNSFWNTQTSGQASSAAGTGKTTAQMKTQSTFTDAGWDFFAETTNGTSDIWGIGNENSGYPFLIWQGLPTSIQPSGSGTAGDPYQITTLSNLYWISVNPSSWSKYFVQKNNIDASSTSKWDNGSGFIPIGQVNTTSFSGTYKGKGYTITGLTIKRLSMSYVALFGVIYGGKVDSLGVENVNINGESNVAGLAGYNFGTINSSYSTGVVTAVNDYAGGLVSANETTISNSYSRCAVEVGAYYAGGLVAYSSGTGIITNSYSTGIVTSVDGSYSGGLSSSNSGTVSNSFWDTESSEQSTSEGGTGKTTSEMKTQSTFTDAGWNFSTIWAIDEITNDGYPFLGWQSPVIPTSGSYTNVTVYAPTSLSGNLTVGGTLTIGAQITTGSNTIDLGTTGNISGETPSNYIVGKVQTTRDVSTAQNNIGGMGISIDPQSNNLGSTTIKRETGTAETSGAIKQVWTITPTSQPSGPVTVTLTWPSTNDNNVNLTDLVVYKSEDGGDTWNVISATINKDADPRTATFTISSFSSFTIGESGSLPVEMASFTARSNNGKILLNWSTVTESNNAGWEIEVRRFDFAQRDDNSNSQGNNNTPGTLMPSADGSKGWTTVGFVNGKGTTTELQNYQFQVESSKYQAPSVQFRLKQIDTDGKFSYSNILTVDLTPNNFGLSQNYPNPFNPVTVISYQLSAVSDVRLAVYDLLGREVMTLVNEKKEAGNYSVKFSGTNLTSGVYFYKLTAGNFTEIKKMTLLK